MSRILVSINPEFVERIIKGTKKYEYRRTIAKREVKHLVIYSTWPQKEIVAEVEVLGIIKMPPELLWKETKKYAGISRNRFCDYFKDKKIAYAYILGHVCLYSKGMGLGEIGIKSAPQSFQYLNKEQYKLLNMRVKYNEWNRDMV